MKVLLPIFVLCCAAFNSQVFAKFLIKSFEPCDYKANYPIQMNLTFRNVGDLQYIDETSNFRIPLDNTLQLKSTTEMFVKENTYVYLFSIHERKACDTMHKLLGEFLYEIERNGGVIPGLCPIPQGRHNVHNMALHFERMAILQTIPFGQMRSTTFMVDPKNNTVTCFVSEVENRL